MMLFFLPSPHSGAWAQVMVHAHVLLIQLQPRLQTQNLSPNPPPPALLTSAACSERRQDGPGPPVSANTLFQLPYSRHASVRRSQDRPGRRFTEFQETETGAIAYRRVSTETLLTREWVLSINRKVPRLAKALNWSLMP